MSRLILPHRVSQRLGVNPTPGRTWLTSLALCCGLAAALPVRGLPPAAAATAPSQVSFVREIAPIVLKRCTGCHGERKQEGGYRSHTFAGLIKAGASGSSPIVPGKPAASELFRRLTAKSADERMPQQDDPLTPAEIGRFRRWIAQGATFDGPDRTAPLRALLPPREHPAAPAVYRVPVPVLSLAFAPGGSELFAGGYNEITVWSPRTGALLRRIPHQPQRVQSLTFSPDGKRLLVAGGTPGEYGELSLVAPATGARTLLDTRDDVLLAAAFSRDGSRIAAGGADATIRVYDTATGKALWSNRAHSDWVTSVSFSADGRYLASSSRDMTVKVLEADRGTLYTTYTGHNRQIGMYRGADPVYAVRFAPQGDTAFSAGGGRWVHAWIPAQIKEEAGTAADMEERFAKESRTRHLAHGLQKPVYALALGEHELFAASADGMVKALDPESGKELRSFTGPQDWLFSLTYDPGTGRLAAGAYNGEVRVWDARTGEIVVAFAAQPGRTPRQAASAGPVPNDANRARAR